MHTMVHRPHSTKGRSQAGGPCSRGALSTTVVNRQGACVRARCRLSCDRDACDRAPVAALGHTHNSSTAAHAASRRRLPAPSILQYKLAADEGPPSPWRRPATAAPLCCCASRSLRYAMGRPQGWRTLVYARRAVSTCESLWLMVSGLFRSVHANQSIKHTWGSMQSCMQQRLPCLHTPTESYREHRPSSNQASCMSREPHMHTEGCLLRSCMTLASTGQTTQQKDNVHTVTSEPPDPWGGGMHHVTQTQSYLARDKIIQPETLLVRNMYAGAVDPERAPVAGGPGLSRAAAQRVLVARTSTHRAAALAWRAPP